MVGDVRSRRGRVCRGARDVRNMEAWESRRVRESRSRDGWVNGSRNGGRIMSR